MKKLILSSIAVAALSFAGSKAIAAPMILNVSGTVKFQNVENEFKGTVASHSFTEKNVYNLISNAVANAAGFSIAFVPQHIPADGYIVYNPGSGDGTVEGIFFVTNKSGYYLPLSGYDTNDNYYSYIEFDTTVVNPGENFNLGFYNFNDDLFFSVTSYGLVTTGANIGNGSSTSTSKALLYIHDNPYDYGDPNGNYYNDVYPFDDFNENALEIDGLATTKLNLIDFGVKSGTISITGIGNFLLEDYDFTGVVSGHATL